MKDNEDRLETFKKSISVTTKTIGKNQKTQISFLDGETEINGDVVNIKKPAENLSKKTISLTRGDADSIATQIRYHNSTIHNKYFNKNTTGGNIFNALEKSRCEALGSKEYLGVHPKSFFIFELSIAYLKSWPGLSSTKLISDK